MDGAINRFARAYVAIETMNQQGLPVLEGQKREAVAAMDDLEKAKPGTGKLMKSALRHDPGLHGEMSLPAGRDRSDRIMAHLDRERDQQKDPNVRADRFVDGWNSLKRERASPGGRQSLGGRDRLSTGLASMLEELARDPQMESVLRNRTRELGLENIRQGQNLVQEMQRQMERDRNRDRDRGLER